MSGRLYERITTRRLGAEPRAARPRRGAREIDVEVARHRREPSLRSPRLDAARPTRIY
jgi:hypothetical protein